MSILLHHSTGHGLTEKSTLLLAPLCRPAVASSHRVWEPLAIRNQHAVPVREASTTCGIFPTHMLQKVSDASAPILLDKCPHVAVYVSGEHLWRKANRCKLLTWGWWAGNCCACDLVQRVVSMANWCPHSMAIISRKQPGTVTVARSGLQAETHRCIVTFQHDEVEAVCEGEL